MERCSIVDEWGEAMITRFVVQRHEGTGVTWIDVVTSSDKGVAMDFFATERAKRAQNLHKPGLNKQHWRVIARAEEELVSTAQEGMEYD